MRVRLLTVFSLLLPAAAHAQKVWLVVGASSSSPDGMARAAKPLAARWPGGLIWSDKDRASEAVALPDGRTLVIKRVFKPDLLEDPDQGKDQGVWLAQGEGKLKALVESCSPAEAFTAREGKLAFQCGDSIAADQLMHKVLVFDGERQVSAVSSCRKPRWTGPAALVCSAESIDADGKLALKPKKISIGR